MATYNNRASSAYTCPSLAFRRGLGSAPLELQPFAGVRADDLHAAFAAVEFAARFIATTRGVWNAGPSQGALGSFGLVFAAIDDRHVVEHTAIGLFVADGGDEAVPFLPAGFAANQFGEGAAAAGAFGDDDGYAVFVRAAA